MSGPHTEDPATGDAALPFWTHRAIVALLDFGAIDDDTAGQLLRLWKHRNRLSNADRAEVLDWFARYAPDPAHVTVDQGEGGWASGACAGPTDDDDETEPVSAPVNALTF
jgi:hypothetical protein